MSVTPLNADSSGTTSAVDLLHAINLSAFTHYTAVDWPACRLENTEKAAPVTAERRNENLC